MAHKGSDNRRTRVTTTGTNEHKRAQTSMNEHEQANKQSKGDNDGHERA